MASTRTLPVEVLWLIVEEVGRKDLLSVLLTNSLFHALAKPALYRRIPDLPVRRTIACLKLLADNPTFGTLVHDLTIDWSVFRVTANLLRLLRRALLQLHNLCHLSVELCLRDNIATHAWVFINVPYKLRTFATSTRCDHALAEVLQSQPYIHDLSLRGFQTNLPFALSSSALPRLSSLRCTHAGASVIAEIVKGRPVEGVSISLIASEGFDPLDALRLPSTSVKRLTLMALDEMPVTCILSQVAARVSQLEALHIVVLLSQFTYNGLLEAGSFLSSFKHLRYITVMSGLGVTATDDHEIAKEWHKHCKTLKTIILPKGQVWFERDGQWSCCL